MTPLVFRRHQCTNKGFIKLMLGEKSIMKEKLTCEQNGRGSNLIYVKMLLLRQNGLYECITTQLKT